MAHQTAWQAPDVLSPPARAVLEANAASAYTALVVKGEGWPGAMPLLSPLRPEGMLAGEVRSPDDAAALLAGLWLWHDYLDESHQYSQKLGNLSGNFWHAIVQ